MILRSLALASALAMTGPAAAGDVRPPNNAAGAGLGATGGSIKLPGTANIEAPDIRTTMEEKRKAAEKDVVDPAVVQELRDMAKEAGQTSSSTDDSDE
jgi:hypothetical protein